MRSTVHRFETSGPADVSGLEAALREGRIQPGEILAVLGKTEGNGAGNDFTRELAIRALRDLLSAYLDLSPAAVEQRIVFSFSGGSEGVVTPHYLVFCRSGRPNATPLADRHLALAVGHTRDFQAKEAGYLPMVEETARVVKRLMGELGVTAGDVHLIQIKGAIPASDPEEIRQAAGRPLRNDMAYSRGASALGVALALGEVSAESISDEAICQDWDLYSSVASVSAKPGLSRSEILLFANSHYWEGDCRIEHGLMRDIIDLDGARAVLARSGLECAGQLSPEQRARLVGIFAKSDADPRHRIRGKRHTMWTDEDFSDMRYSRCVVGAILAALTGETAVYVSTRAEHMGPLGGGPLAVIVRDA